MGISVNRQISGKVAGRSSINTEIEREPDVIAALDNKGSGCCCPEELKKKLESIEWGAEVNVQSD